MSRQKTSCGKKAQEPNHYEILGVSQDASDDDIKAKYKTLVLKFHPDREDSILAREAIVRINNAYEVLADPQSRMAYDSSLNATSKEAPCNKTKYAKTGMLPYIRVGKTALVLLAIILSISFIAGYQTETLHGSKPVADQFVRANSHFLTAVTHEALVILPLFIPGFGLIWGVLGGFISGFVAKSVLIIMASPHTKTSGLFMPYFVLALAMKLVAYYLGMSRSLMLVISIRRRQFSKFDSMFTQADIVIGLVLSAIAGLVEHAMVST